MNTFETRKRTAAPLFLVVAMSCHIAANMFAADNAPSGAALLTRENTSLRNEVRRAIAKGLAWLEKNQDAKGFWSTADHPAVTSLALVAAQGDPARASRVADPAFIVRGYAFLKSCAHDDGSVYAKKELVNYNTSVALMAFAVSRRAEFKPEILKARQYLIGTQVDLGEAGKVDNVFDGGIGYGSKYEHSDMANTLMALEALYYSKQFAADEKLAGARDLNWPAVIHFIQSCQNLPSHNPEKWASDDPQNRGGFIYYPGQSMAGETNLPSGRVAFRSYGSASYAGLLSYIYAELKRDDPRVVAVLDWLRGNYTLAENPGMGPQGIFYYLHTMTKALSIYGLDVLETKDGRKHYWREEVALKLIDLQKNDGSWANDNGRWWEKDAALVTAYALISLEMIERKL